MITQAYGKRYRGVSLQRPRLAYYALSPPAVPSFALKARSILAWGEAPG